MYIEHVRSRLSTGCIRSHAKRVGDCPDLTCSAWPSSFKKHSRFRSKQVPSFFRVGIEHKDRVHKANGILGNIEPLFPPAVLDNGATVIGLALDCSRRKSQLMLHPDMRTFRDGWRRVKNIANSTNSIFFFSEVSQIDPGARLLWSPTNHADRAPISQKRSRSLGEEPTNCNALSHLPCYTAYRTRQVSTVDRFHQGPRGIKLVDCRDQTCSAWPGGRALPFAIGALVGA